MNQLGGYLGSAIRHMQAQGHGVAQILEHVAQNRQPIADVPASSSSSSNQPPPPPPPAAGAVAIEDRKKKKVTLTPDEALDRLLAKHDRKKARQAERAARRSAPYVAPDIPRPPPLPLPDRQPEVAPTIERRGEKRKSEKQLQKRTKPSQPVVVERFDISEGDHLPPGAQGDQEPSPVTFDLGTVTTLAKHMASTRRRPAPRAEQSTAPAVRTTTEQQNSQALTKEAKKAVKTSTRVRKELTRKPRKVDRPTNESNVTYV